MSHTDYTLDLSRFYEACVELERCRRTLEVAQARFRAAKQEVDGHDRLINRALEDAKEKVAARAITAPEASP